MGDKYKSILLTKEDTELVIAALKLQNKTLTEKDRDKIETNEALQFEYGELLKKF